MNLTRINFVTLDTIIFHRLGNDIVKVEYPNTKCLDGSGGDEGIDCYDGNLFD